MLDFSDHNSMRYGWWPWLYSYPKTCISGRGRYATRLSTSMLGTTGSNRCSDVYGPLGVWVGMLMRGFSGVRLSIMLSALISTKCRA